MTDAPEMKQKIQPLTFAFGAVLLFLGINIGMGVSDLKHGDAMQMTLHEFALDEVGGVRADMEKEDKFHREELQRLQLQIDRIENESLERLKDAAK